MQLLVVMLPWEMRRQVLDEMPPCPHVGPTSESAGPGHHHPHAHDIEFEELD